VKEKDLKLNRRMPWKEKWWRNNKRKRAGAWHRFSNNRVV